MLKRTAAVSAALLASTLAFAPQASAADENATVYVLHAVPDATVDVYVNGTETLTDFKPGTLTDALSLPAGEYDLKVTAAGAGADGEAIMEANDVAVPAGANVTVVAHLSADSKPMLSPFVNDMKKVAAGQGRLTVRHVAAAPAVDVRANGTVAFANLANPDEAMADLPSGEISADVALAGTDTVALGPADLNIAEGANTIVYAWGSAEAGNLALATQVIDGLHSAPDGVPSGDAPMGSDSTTRMLVVTGLALMAGAAVLFGRRREALVRR